MAREPRYEQDYGYAIRMGGLICEKLAEDFE